MIVWKLIICATLMGITYQDIKERQVYWFLFPISAVCFFGLMYNEIMPELLTITLSINFALVACLLLVVFVYAKFKLGVGFLKAFALGDVLMFLALVFTFSNISFIILLVFGLIFSLVLHLFLKKHSKHDTVPLAGYLSLFFLIAYIGNWIGLLPMLYIL